MSDYLFMCVCVQVRMCVCVRLFVLYRARFRLAALTLTPEEQTVAIFAIGSS